MNDSDMYILGVDPGIQTAAMAGISLNQYAYQAVMLPTVNGRLDVHGVHTLLLDFPLNVIRHVFIERAQAMPKQGISSTFRYGESYGMLCALLAACCVPYTEITPQTWKKAFAIRSGGGQAGSATKSYAKERAREIASQLFPYVDLSKKKDHHKAESLLIAEYGRKIYQGKGEG